MNDNEERKEVIKKMEIEKLSIGMELKPCVNCEHYKASQKVEARWEYRAPRITQMAISQDMLCSACFKAFPRRDGDRWRYCPNCGAKMIM